MKLETEKNIASEIDNLMENCDSTQTNNITRKKALQDIDWMHHLRKRISQMCIMHALVLCTLDSLSIYLPPKNRHTFLHELLVYDV